MEAAKKKKQLYLLRQKRTREAQAKKRAIVLARRKRAIAIARQKAARRAAWAIRRKQIAAA